MPQQHTKLQFYVLVKALLTSVPKDNAIGKEGYHAENIFKISFKCMKNPLKKLVKLKFDISICPLGSLQNIYFFKGNV